MLKGATGRQKLALWAFLALAAGALVLVAVFARPAAGAGGAAAPAGNGSYSASTFAMDTLVDQTAWGENATEAMRRVNLALAAFDSRLSLFAEDGDIARINRAAGGAGAAVAPETEALLGQALALSAESDGAFAITIAPLTLAWGVTGDSPRVVPEAELAGLLPLVNDRLVEMGNGRVRLPKKGMGIDLGGIAKGAACTLAADIYEEYGVESAWLWIGGNTYVRGRKPDGTPFRIGFENPAPGGEAYLASFIMEDAVIAVSGGHHRYFEAGGRRYIHILNPATGRPAESDILAVGAIRADGAEADFYSTTYFVWGLEKTLAHMAAGGTAIVLDENGTLWVSESLREGFELNERAGVAEVEFVPGG